MSKFNVWMYDPFGYRFAVVMIGNYNVIQATGQRMAFLLGGTFDFLEEIR